jgi:rSAM/selenodomain-associated transferase 2
VSAAEMKGWTDPKSNLSVGIVVPVYNEAATLDHYLSRLYEVTRGRYPVVVVDGGSSDNTRDIARRYFDTECVPLPNRGAQLNHGAQCLATDVLLFLHADSELPRGFDFYLRTALAEDVVGGCFRLQFDRAHPLLKLYCWFTRFRWRFFHFGDQGFFVRSEVFREMGGFAPLPFLEDVDFLKRLKKRGKFATLPAAVKTSARRFVQGGILRQQLANIFLVALFELGVAAERLARVYPHVR